MDYNFKYYGKIDVTNLNILLSEVESNWDEYTYRQRKRYGQSETKTIPLIWSEDFKENTTWESYGIFKESLIEIENILNNIICGGKIEVAILVNLPKNKKIYPHVDSIGEHFFKTKRIHIPIITNDLCNFIVGDEIVKMKSGEIWEINNGYKTHSVNNDGDTDRIHLLIDYLPEDKKTKTLL